MTPDNMPTKAQAVKVHWELTRTRYALIHQLVYLRLSRHRPGIVLGRGERVVGCSVAAQHIAQASRGHAGHAGHAHRGEIMAV